MTFSVVIPTYNEAAYLQAALDSVEVQQAPWEIVVVDGNSTDQTREIASSSAQLVVSPRGRARQMNAGAIATEGDVLIFLHADSALPVGAFRYLRDLLKQQSIEAGTFSLKFDQDGFWPSLYATCACIQWHRLCFGDRGLFVRRKTFDAVGGFPNVPIFEDLEIVRQLHRRGTFHYIDVPVTTAFRRFNQSGTVSQQWLNLKLWLRYQMGTSPDQLACHYPYLPTK